VALGSELVRADEATRETATAGFKRLVDVVAKQFRRGKSETAKGRAEFIVCAMVGALTMSRMVTDPALSASILEQTRKWLAEV
jgi:TetR/AcrR family transcriptional regulator, transcriptional repressor for nem operon